MDDVEFALVNNLPVEFAAYLVVKVTLVLVTVSVYRAEEASAPACEPSQPDLLLAGATTILLLLAVLVSILVLT